MNNICVYSKVKSKKKWNRHVKACLKKINNETGFKGLFNPNSTWRLFAEDKCCSFFCGKKSFEKALECFIKKGTNGSEKISC